MANKKINIPEKQMAIDFNNPIEPPAHWPNNEKFPLNRRDYYDRKFTVLEEILKDIYLSDHYLVVTGFTSLAHIIEIFGRKVDFEKTKKIRVVLGFEPELRTRKYWKGADLDKEIKDYWAEQNYSLLNGGEVIRIIEYIKQGVITFKLTDGLHAKIYVGTTNAILGSANFSKNGTTIQKEANIKVSANPKNKLEAQQYADISSIANNFYNEAKNYDDAIISLFEGLLKVSRWEEALARAIVELIERQWLKDIPELYSKLNSIKLWPSQRLGLGQALYILQTQGCVLIADPTGSGKTKLISTLQLVLFYWLWETGRRNKSYAITICPPLVKDSWNKEFIDIEFSQNSQISMGALSYGKGQKYLNHIKEVKIANILVVDEAHNFLSLKSNRSVSVAEHTSDNIILATATPINRKAKDLLRLIELLGVDNLNDEELSQFRVLKKQKSIRNSSSDLNSLRDYIKKFIVRRTKKQLNELIDQEPDLYINRQGDKCRYPIHDCQTYATGETKDDKLIAAIINEKAKNLKGLIYLQDISRPDYDFDEENYIERRLKAAKALTVYNVQAKLRSSRAALVEHIEGTKVSLDYFKFKSKKDETGNVINSLKKHSQRLPKNDFKNDSPIWLVNYDDYEVACKEEIRTYSEISTLAKRISDRRENQKVDKILSYFKIHKLVLAFDSTIITLDYLNSLIRARQSIVSVYVINGVSTKATVANILKKFDLGSTSENIVALCSDSMSEGVNLQQASALVFLDMPSVLRIAEQRIGRIDRLDSPHKKITIYWPNDSDEFSLRTDSKLIRTSIDTESLIGSNFTIPDELLDKHMEQIIKADDMIKALKEDDSQDYLWDGIQDAFKSIHDLYQGSNPLIAKKDYEYYKDVDAAVKVKLSIAISNTPWLFLAVKGTKSITPKWFFIDSQKKIHHELSDICVQLRENLIKENNWENKWDEQVSSEFSEYVKILKDEEINLLPSKRKRALKVAEEILKKKLVLYKNDYNMCKLIKEVLSLFKPKNIEEEYSIDYYNFAQKWLDLFTPLLHEKKKSLKRGSREVITLNNLIKDHKNVVFTYELLEKILNDVPLLPSIWNRIAACIIGIQKVE